MGTMANSFGSRSTLEVGKRSYRDSPSRRRSRRPGLHPGRLPFSLRILLENLLRTRTASPSRRPTSARSPAGTRRPSRARRSPSCRRASCCRTSPACPAVVDLAAMRAAIKKLGGDPKRINPLLPAELVIDHSVQVDEYGKRRGAVAERADRVLAQQGALRLPALGPVGVPQLRGRAARHRHRPPGEPRVPGARRLHDRRLTQGRRRSRPTPTRSSAPTRTRR